jgi:ATP-binding cassette subfamily B protein
VSFAVGPGEKAALVGATGSGKTTIINLISRFYDIQAGEIRINGANLRRYQLDFLRGLSGVVLQDVFLFSGSIHDNITLNEPDVSRERVIEAAKQVGAHDFISRLPGGYDYQVQERGATLSLGQRQLIAFARVMVYDPRVLILDEATANIDTESEEVIQHAIDTILTGRTSIIIAHRLSTIQKADQIIVLQKGKLIEKGSHQELLAAEGAYFQLHQMQFMAES